MIEHRQPEAPDPTLPEPNAEVQLWFPWFPWLPDDAEDLDGE